MKEYICLIHTTQGAQGAIVERDEKAQQTKDLLDRGIIAEHKVKKPTETKARKSRKKAD